MTGLGSTLSTFPSFVVYFSLGGVLIALFVLPFLLVGFVWGKLLIRRRMLRPGGR